MCLRPALGVIPSTPIRLSKLEYGEVSSDENVSTIRYYVPLIPYRIATDTQTGGRTDAHHTF